MFAVEPCSFLLNEPKPTGFILKLLVSQGQSFLLAPPWFPSTLLCLFQPCEPFSPAFPRGYPSGLLANPRRSRTGASAHPGWLGYDQGRAFSGCWKRCQGKKAATIPAGSGPACRGKTLAARDAFLQALELRWVQLRGLCASGAGLAPPGSALPRAQMVALAQGWGWQWHRNTGRALEPDPLPCQRQLCSFPPLPHPSPPPISFSI